MSNTIKIIRHLLLILFITLVVITILLVYLYWLKKIIPSVNLLNVSVFYLGFILLPLYYCLIKINNIPILAITSSLLIVSTTFIFSIFGPVFIDRSLSYHIIFLAEEEKNLNINQISNEAFQYIFIRRFEELDKAGMIKISSQGEINLTYKGLLISKSLLLIGASTNLLEGYNDFKRAANYIDK